MPFDQCFKIATIIHRYVCFFLFFSTTWYQNFQAPQNRALIKTLEKIISDSPVLAFRTVPEDIGVCSVLHSYVCLYTVLEANENPTNNITVFFSAFELHEGRKGLSFLKSSETANRNGHFWRWVYTSTSYLNTELWMVFRNTVGSIMPGLPSCTTIGTLWFASAGHNQPQI